MAGKKKKKKKKNPGRRRVFFFFFFYVPIVFILFIVRLSLRAPKKHIPYSKDVNMNHYSIHPDREIIATVTTGKREEQRKKPLISQNTTEHRQPLHTANKVK